MVSKWKKKLFQEDGGKLVQCYAVEEMCYKLWG